MPALPVEREGRILRCMRFARSLGAGLLPVLGSLWSVAGCGLLLDLDPRDDAAVGRDAGSDAGASERCDDGVDDDGDGAADCLDLDCEADAACADFCDGVDDDGDGRIDESPADPTVGVPCFEGDPALAGIGACVHGVTVCEGGALSCLGSGAPSEETCNGVDDDCDGALLPEEGTVGCSTDVVTPGATRVVVEVALPPLDVHANLDTTGSMGGVLAGLRAELTGEIAPRVRALLPDAAFGLSTFDDFPVGAFGQLEDRPFILRQRITTDLEALQSALDEVTLHFGADAPESGVEALHQIATGAGVSWHRLDGTVDAVPAVDCEAGFDAGLGHGRLGGACFRPTALPVVVHVTDAQSHDGADYRAFDPRILAASATATMAELRTLGARVVGIRPASTSSMVEPTSLLWHEGMATATGAVAPLCGFDGAAARGGDVRADRVLHGDRRRGPPARGRRVPPGVRDPHHGRGAERGDGPRARSAHALHHDGDRHHPGRRSRGLRRRALLRAADRGGLRGAARRRVQRHARGDRHRRGRPARRPARRERAHARGVRADLREPRRARPGRRRRSHRGLRAGRQLSPRRRRAGRGPHRPELGPGHHHGPLTSGHGY
ncbi:MAG: hypothetical protein M5U28_28535 [Sandaracinaceae bacterium]|nr:hypothetical protein [Sandaracinaceae bacterium]